MCNTAGVVSAQLPFHVSSLIFSWSISIIVFNSLLLICYNLSSLLICLWWCHFRDVYHHRLLTIEIVSAHLCITLLTSSAFLFFLCKNFPVKQSVGDLVSSSLQVVCMNFFDVVLDFILMDAFEDLESPPSSVVAVLRNRWLSDSFKETVN